jgi:hypothetical protein
MRLASMCLTHLGCRVSFGALWHLQATPTTTSLLSSTRVEELYLYEHGSALCTVWNAASDFFVLGIIAMSCRAVWCFFFLLLLWWMSSTRLCADLPRSPPTIKRRHCFSRFHHTVGQSISVIPDDDEVASFLFDADIAWGLPRT